MLMRAEFVTFLMSTDDGGGSAPPDAALQALRQAGVQVAEHRFHAGGRRIGAALLAEADAAGADLLVMGAYTRGRLPEFVLGGATREVLALADLPVLMQH
jgi:nucleotide-binding universal stress UspA family protein